MFARFALAAVLLVPSFAVAQATKPATQPNDYPALRAQMERLTALVKQLQKENAELRERIAQTKPPAGTITPGMTFQQVAQATGATSDAFRELISRDAEGNETWVFALPGGSRAIRGTFSAGKLVEFGEVRGYSTSSR